MSDWTDLPGTGTSSRGPHSLEHARASTARVRSHRSEPRRRWVLHPRSYSPSSCGRFGGRVAPELHSRDGTVVHLVRTVGQTERSDGSIIVCKPKVVSHSAAAVCLNRMIDDSQSHPGRGHFDHRNLAAGALVT